MVASAGIWPELALERRGDQVGMVSGLAPGSCVVTWMVGKSTCGSDETGSHQ